MAAALACIAISALGLLLFGAPSTMAPRSVAAAQLSVPSTSPEQSAVPAAVLSPPGVPEPIAEAPGSYIAVQATDRSWVVACADGKVLFSRLFTAGDRHMVKFDREAIVRVGRAGSVQIIKDGKFTGPLGVNGQVRIVAFTPEDAHFLNGVEDEDCTYAH